MLWMWVKHPRQYHHHRTAVIEYSCYWMDSQFCTYQKWLISFDTVICHTASHFQIAQFVHIQIAWVATTIATAIIHVNDGTNWLNFRLTTIKSVSDTIDYVIAHIQSTVTVSKFNICRRRLLSVLCNARMFLIAGKMQFDIDVNWISGIFRRRWLILFLSFC